MPATTVHTASAAHLPSDNAGGTPQLNLGYGHGKRLAFRLAPSGQAGIAHVELPLAAQHPSTPFSPSRTLISHRPPNGGNAGYETLSDCRLASRPNPRAIPLLRDLHAAFVGLHKHLSAGPTDFSFASHVSQVSSLPRVSVQCVALGVIVSIVARRRIPAF